MKEKRSYEEALNELETIVSEIEDGDTSIDELTTKIKKAAELLKFCKDKLTNTEKDVEEILAELKE